MTDDTGVVTDTSRLVESLVGKVRVVIPPSEQMANRARVRSKNRSYRGFFSLLCSATARNTWRNSSNRKYLRSAVSTQGGLPAGNAVAPPGNAVSRNFFTGSHTRDGVYRCGEIGQVERLGPDLNHDRAAPGDAQFVGKVDGTG